MLEPVDLDGGHVGGGGLEIAPVDLDQAAVRRVCEDELRADSPLTVDRPGQRVLVDVVRPEPGILPGR
jgi:hypothetical protein